MRQAGNIVTPLSKHTVRLSSRAGGAKLQHASANSGGCRELGGGEKMRPKCEDAKWKRRWVEERKRKHVCEWRLICESVDGSYGTCLSFDEAADKRPIPA